MYRIRDLSIKQKLNTIVMLTTGTALFLGFVAFVAYDIMTSRQNIARNLSMMAEIVANNSTAALTFSDPKSAEGMQPRPGRFAKAVSMVRSTDRLASSRINSFPCRGCGSVARLKKD